MGYSYSAGQPPKVDFSFCHSFCFLWSLMCFLARGGFQDSCSHPGSCLAMAGVPAASWHPYQERGDALPLRVVTTRKSWDFPGNQNAFFTLQIYTHRFMNIYLQKQRCSFTLAIRLSETKQNYTSKDRGKRQSKSNAPPFLTCPLS